jgi:hypothetical protein
MTIMLGAFLTGDSFKLKISNWNITFPGLFQNDASVIYYVLMTMN